MLQDHQSQNCPLRSFRSPVEPNMLKPLATVCLFLISVVAGTLVSFRFGKVIISTVFLIMSHLRPGKEKVYVSVLYFLKTCYGSVFICVFILVSCQVSQGKIFYISLLALEKLLLLQLCFSFVFWFLLLQLYFDSCLMSGQPRTTTTSSPVPEPDADLQEVYYRFPKYTVQT